MLHPQTRALLDLIEQRGIPPTHTLSVADARALYRDRRSFTQPAPPEVAKVQDLHASGPNGTVPVRLVRPLGSDETTVLPVLVYFHGGGWVIGDLDTHDTLCRELANGAGCAVVSVDYRMGPEQRFPAAVEDSFAATRWVRDHAASLHLDPTRLAVGGDSAGGNLATVVAIAARDAGDLPIMFQLLIYPATDQHRTTPSHAQNGQGYLLTSDTMDYFTGHYIADPADHDDWRASPLLRKDLERLPPALVLTAGFDPLRDEGKAYAERLTAAGNAATYVCFERQVHGFVLMGKVLDEARSAVTLCAAELRRAFERG
ncbi:MAG: alpha/beta hydrolase [Pseudomonadota bacterium]|nr:alpha/beta hydrolase [Pseudomonadota bacterium]